MGRPEHTVGIVVGRLDLHNGSPVSRRVGSASPVSVADDSVERRGRSRAVKGDGLDVVVVCVVVDVFDDADGGTCARSGVDGNYPVAAWCSQDDIVRRSCILNCVERPSRVGSIASRVG